MCKIQTYQQTTLNSRARTKCNPTTLSAALLCLFLASPLTGVWLNRVMRSDTDPGSYVVRVMRRDPNLQSYNPAPESHIVRVMRSDPDPGSYMIRVMRSDPDFQSNIPAPESHMVRVMRNKPGLAWHASYSADRIGNEDKSFMRIYTKREMTKRLAPFYRQTRKFQQEMRDPMEAAGLTEDYGPIRLTRLM